MTGNDVNLNLVHFREPQVILIQKTKSLPMHAFLDILDLRRTLTKGHLFGQEFFESV